MSDYYARRWAELTDSEQAESAAGHLESEGWEPDAKFVREMWKALDQIASGDLNDDEAWLCALAALERRP